VEHCGHASGKIVGPQSTRALYPSSTAPPMRALACALRQQNYLQALPSARCTPSSSVFHTQLAYGLGIALTLAIEVFLALSCPHFAGCKRQECSGRAVLHAREPGEAASIAAHPAVNHDRDRMEQQHACTWPPRVAGVLLPSRSGVHPTLSEARLTDASRIDVR
jgi:hypothetical protein